MFNNLDKTLSGVREIQFNQKMVNSKFDTHYEKVGDKYIVYRTKNREVQKNYKYFRPNLKQFFNDEDLKRVSNDTKIGQAVNS